jgi:peptidoglycan/LPS O-acetylase OafA/YrhL
MLNSIQLLRAFAALSVVLNHYASYAFGIDVGGFGVDIFFIISGFIIAYIVSKDVNNFLIKRIIRIVPLYMIATLMMTGVILLFPNLVNSTNISFSTIIKSLLFIPLENSSPILKQGWTLNFEMFFYLIMGICILFINRGKILKRYLSIICVVILLIFMSLLNLINIDNYILSFYQNGLLLEFIYGLLLYQGYVYCGRRFALHYTILPPPPRTKIHYNLISKSIILISLLYLFLSDIYGIQISKNRNINYGIPCLMLVIGVLGLENYINKNSLLIRLGIELGNASYAMYLFHPFVIYFFQRIIFHKINLILPGIGLLKLIISLFMTIFVSILIYRLVDKPIQNILRHIIKMK